MLTSHVCPVALLYIPHEFLYYCSSLFWLTSVYPGCTRVQEISLLHIIYYNKLKSCAAELIVYCTVCIILYNSTEYSTYDVMLQLTMWKLSSLERFLLLMLV